MKNWVEQINGINNIEQFKIFLADLASDAEENPEEWENQRITDYLGQMSVWIDDRSAVNSDIDWESVDFKTFAKILYMGKIYE